MEEAALLDGMSGPEDEIVQDLFGAESRFVPENMPLKAPVAGKAEQDECHVLRDVYLSTADPKEPLLQAFSPPLDVTCSDQVTLELLVNENEEGDMLGDHELHPLEDAALPAAPPPPAPPQTYNVHFLSSLLTPHRSPAVVPLGTWAREGAAHPGVRLIPVELKEGGDMITSNIPEEASQQSHLAQEPACKFRSSREAEEAAGCSHKKDLNPVVICQLKRGTQVLCIDNCGTRELKTLHLVPQYQDQSDYSQSDAPKPMTALVGRFLPVPAKLNLIAQQLDSGSLPPTANGSSFPVGSALPGPPKITLAGVTLSSWNTNSKKPCNCTKSQCLKLYCDCFASGDFCNNCNCNNCCNNLRNEMERFKAIKACLDRNPEAFQPKIGKGKLGDVKPRHNKGCNCKRSGCLKNYCECYEAKIMCSSICKCIGCKNYEESPERKTLMATSNCMDAGGSEGSPHLPAARPAALPKLRRGRRASCISWEVVEATCACLLAQGEEAEKENHPEYLAQQVILEEFGRCLSQILYAEFKSKGLKMESSAVW